MKSSLRIETGKMESKSVELMEAPSNTITSKPIRRSETIIIIDDETNNDIPSSSISSSISSSSMMKQSLQFSKNIKRQKNQSLDNQQHSKKSTQDMDGRILPDTCCISSNNNASRSSNNTTSNNTTSTSSQNRKPKSTREGRKTQKVFSQSMIKNKDNKKPPIIDLVGSGNYAITDTVPSQTAVVKLKSDPLDKVIRLSRPHHNRPSPAAMRETNTQNGDADSHHLNSQDKLSDGVTKPSLFARLTTPLYNLAPPFSSWGGYEPKNNINATKSKTNVYIQRQGTKRRTHPSKCENSAPPEKKIKPSVTVVQIPNKQRTNLPPNNNNTQPIYNLLSSDDSSDSEEEKPAPVSKQKGMDVLPPKCQSTITVSPDFQGDPDFYPPSKTPVRSTHIKLKSEKTDRKYAIKQDIMVVDSDDSDSFQPSPWFEKAKKVKTERLAKFDGDADRALQELLWKIGCSVTLLPHQPEAVRKIAGVPMSFPLNTKDTTTNITLHTATETLPPNPPTRGVLVADEMGLGKTIQALVGAYLNLKIAEVKHCTTLPVIIVSPNHAVQRQWRETLLYKIGVESERIIEFKSGDKEGFQGPNFILMEKSKIQSEMKAVFDGLYKENNTKQSSPLFPHVVNTQIIRTLHNQYISAKGYTQNKYKIDGENIDDCVTRILKNFYATQKRANKEPVFEMVVIDEAHQLKNRKAMWAMGVGLMSLHAKRCIPLTGTPYGNRATDLGTLMTFIDPRLRSTRTDFWRNATSLGDVRSITENLTDWKETYLVRRTKDTVLKGILPSISSSSKTVPQHPSELFVQKKYEANMKKILGTLTQNLNDDNFNPFVRNEVDLMLACMASLRSVCIHPLLGGKGREITKLFSPSRNKNLKESNISKCCVHCYQSLRPTIPCDEEARKRNEKDRNRRKKLKLNRLNIDLDGDDIVDEDDEEIIEYGEILMPVPPSLCKRHGMYGGPQHFAHENCLQDLLLANDGCPRCVDLSRRIHIQMENQAPFQSRYYCKFIETIPGEPGGFKGSSKINAVVDHVIQSIPKDDKVLLLSFFKGSLDLLEGIFYHEYGLDCARFDGDLTAEHASAELERFKRSPTCKILLASVQSGGTGLNIVEANHVLFIDRWFNPFVHSQARDRCHRIGQKKEVEVAFFDNSGSVDEVMRLVNKFKAQNAKVVLSDGTDLGDLGGNALNYMELSGLLSRAFDGVIGARERSVAEKGLDALVPPTCESLIDAILANDRKSMTKMMRGEITKK